MGKMGMLAGAGVGFLLGSRAGRAPYEAFSAQVKRLMRDPRVQQGVDQAKSTVKDKATEVAAEVKHKATDVAGDVKDKATSKTGQGSTNTPSTTGASINDPDIDMTAGPQGDLP